MRQWRYVAVGVIGLSAGCGRQDAEKLARVGWRLSEKVQALVPERTPLGSPWRTIPDGGLEGLVRSRFDADKFLGPMQIEVIATGGGVRLRGTVEDEVLRHRAVEMAESTVGVQKVIDELSPGR